MGAKLTLVPSGGGPHGPEDPMLETRVAALEIKVGGIETKIDRIEISLNRIEETLKMLADKSEAMQKSINDLREKVAHIDGRLANVPTSWQIVGILLGIAAIIFTASRFLHP
jgi:uncharacterized coiled-coil protein SlyX